jgi:hypothetical protein
VESENILRHCQENGISPNSDASSNRRIEFRVPYEGDRPREPEVVTLR